MFLSGEISLFFDKEIGKKNWIFSCYFSANLINFSLFCGAKFRLKFYLRKQKNSGEISLFLTKKLGKKFGCFLVILVQI